MHVDFSERRALVTGGTRGIGAAIVDALVGAGCTVISTGTSAESTHSAQQAAKEAGRAIRYAPVNLEDRDATERFAEQMASERLDVLINNAGINRLGLVGELTMSDWDAVMAVNLRAPTVLCNAIVPGMVDRGYGRIVNIGSIFGNVSRSKRVSYSTSKFGLMGLTRAIALDHAARNVLANVISPGFIDTELTRSILTPEQCAELAASTPMRRLGRPEEIARAVAFLASEANSFATGQQLIVDGGFTSA